MTYTWNEHMRRALFRVRCWLHFRVGWGSPSRLGSEAAFWFGRDAARGIAEGLRRRGGNMSETDLTITIDDETLEAFRRFAEAAQELVDAVRELAEAVVAAMRRFWAQIQEAFRTVWEWLDEHGRRREVYRRLRRYRVPDRVAVLLARWWPCRWLPAWEGV